MKVEFMSPSRIPAARRKWSCSNSEKVKEKGSSREQEKEVGRRDSARVLEEELQDMEEREEKA